MAKKRKYGFNDDQKSITSVSWTTKCLTGEKYACFFFSKYGDCIQLKFRLMQRDL